MVSISIGTFRCVLLTPQGRQLDCRARSIILPGHDGMFGVLRNHAPMLSKLGTGIMEVRGIDGREDAFFLVEGGFTRISENYVTVLTHFVTTFEGMDRKEAEKIVSEAHSLTIGKAYMQTQKGDADLKKAGYIVKLGKMASIIPSQES